MSGRIAGVVVALVLGAACGEEKRAKRCEGAKACEAQCARGHGRSCSRAAWLARGAGEHERAAELAVRGCDAGFADACYDASVSYRAGRGVAVDRKRGLALLERAHDLWKNGCKRDDLEACAGYGGAVAVGQPDLARDRERGLELLDRACDGGLGDACSTLAMHYQGIYGPEDEERAAKTLAREAKLRGRECDRGDVDACARLGEMLLDGEGVDADAERADRLLRRACQRDAEVACLALGRAAKEKDPPRAVEHYQQACDLGIPFGCGQAAKLLLPTEPARAVELAERACAAGSWRDCLGIAEALRAGTAGPRDDPRAERLEQRGAVMAEVRCEDGAPLSCSLLARLYDEGRGVGRDPARAAELRKLACDRGDPLCEEPAR